MLQSFSYALQGLGKVINKRLIYFSPEGHHTEIRQKWKIHRPLLVSLFGAALKYSEHLLRVENKLNSCIHWMLSPVSHVDITSHNPGVKNS